MNDDQRNHLQLIANGEYWKIGPGFDRVAELAKAVIELKDEVMRLQFPLTHIDADSAPARGVTSSQLATGTNLHTVFGTGTDDEPDANAGLVNIGKIDVSATAEPSTMFTRQIEEELDDICADIQQGGSWTRHRDRFAVLNAELAGRFNRMREKLSRTGEIFPPQRARTRVRDELVVELGVSLDMEPNHTNSDLLRQVVDRILDRLVQACEDYPYFADGPSVLKAVKAGRIEGVGVNDGPF